VAGPDLSGEVLDQRYRILDRISQGAMGVVYRGVRMNLDRQVAIKVMHVALPDAMKVRERFEREAQVMARLDHPHCVSIIDYGFHRNKPFVVMELVRGQSLHEMIVEQKRFEIPRAVDVMRQVLSGLAHAHEQGIIHRDIKPANIMITPKAPLGLHVRILDFGLARMLGNNTSISNGVAVGTPSYMAPEQCRGETLDVTCDICACGVVLFEMLTGRKPLTADDPLATVKKQLEEPPPRLADVAPGDYGALEDIVARALKKAPGERFPTATAMSEALDAALGGRSAAESTAVLPKAGNDASAMIPITVGSSVQVARPTAPRSRAPLVIVLFALLAAGGAAAVYLNGRSEPSVAASQLPSRQAHEAPAPPHEVPVVPAPPTHEAPVVPAPDPVVVTTPVPVIVSQPAADPADAIASDAKTLADGGKVDKAIDMLAKARATYPDRAVLPLLAGKLYFGKLWWTDGIASFRAAFKLDPSLKGDPEVIAAAVRGFLTTPAYDGRLAALVLEIGHPAAPLLQDAAQSHRDPGMRARAAALAKRL
jgi:serine/threonine-protein kinase